MASSLIDTFEEFISILNCYICPFILIFGISGNLLNLIVFTRQTFSKQSYSIYFLCISLTNIGMYLIGLTTRILTDGYKLSIFSNNSNIYCKIRNYLVYTLFSISSWLYVLVSLDRFFATNQSTLKRQFYCSYKTAFKFILLTIVICSLTHIHMLIYYGYYYKLNAFDQFTLTCTTNILAYDYFYAFFILIFYSLLPPILMSIISLLTIKNLQKSRQNVNCITMITLSRTMKYRRDANQLIKVLSLQIFILILFTIPHSIYWLYIAFTVQNNSNKTNLTREYEKLFLQIVRVLLYINYGCSFYIQIIISKTFRHEFKKIFQHIFQIFQREN